MKEKKRSNCCLTLNKTWIWIGISLAVISICLVYLILDRTGNSPFRYQTFHLSASKVPSVANQTLKTLSIDQPARVMCSTKWYKQLHLEFNAFSVNHFEKVLFLMDDSYVNMNQSRRYKCVFFQFGTNIKLKVELLTPFGGEKISDPYHRTFSLQCRIPIQAVHRDAMIIHFLLILGNDYRNAVNISVCRSYDSSYHFSNSRLYLENEMEFNPTNKTTKRDSSLIAACTQTSHYEFNFPLWINYHYKMGIDHFYIYDHARSNKTRLHRSLKSYIDSKIVTIVPWYIDQWEEFEHHSSPLDWVSHQIWSENDCIHRYGHLYSWILISDVDEFVVPMGRWTNFREILDKVPSNYCALQLLNANFRGLSGHPPVEEKDRPKIYVLREIKISARNENSKNFVRPHLIYYYAVHQVTLSVNDTPVYYANAHTLARLQHYRAILIEPDEISRYVIDTRILSFLNSTGESISSIISN